jgi:hypothetical protein
VALAPTISKWLVYPRRQAKPVEDALAMLKQAFHVATPDARFILGGESGRYAVTMATDSASDVADEDRGDFVRFFLSHAIGEGRTMAAVHSTSLELPDATTSYLTPAELVERLSSD